MTLAMAAKELQASTNTVALRLRCPFMSHTSRFRAAKAQQTTPRTVAQPLVSTVERTSQHAVAGRVRGVRVILWIPYIKTAKKPHRADSTLLCRFVFACGSCCNSENYGSRRLSCLAEADRPCCVDGIGSGWVWVGVGGGCGWVWMLLCTCGLAPRSTEHASSYVHVNAGWQPSGAIVSSDGDQSSTTTSRDDLQAFTEPRSSNLPTAPSAAAPGHVSGVDGVVVGRCKEAPHVQGAKHHQSKALRRGLMYVPDSGPSPPTQRSFDTCVCTARQSVCGSSL